LALKRNQRKNGRPEALHKMLSPKYLSVKMETTILEWPMKIGMSIERSKKMVSRRKRRKIRAI
jgi:hypothetical protein